MPSALDVKLGVHILVSLRMTVSFLRKGSTVSYFPPVPRSQNNHQATFTVVFHSHSFEDSLEMHLTYTTREGQTHVPVFGSSLHGCLIYYRLTFFSFYSPFLPSPHLAIIPKTVSSQWIYFLPNVILLLSPPKSTCVMFLFALFLRHLAFSRICQVHQQAIYASFEISVLYLPSCSMPPGISRCRLM